MFGNVFLPAAPKSVTAKFCVDLVNRNRIEANNGQSVSRHIPTVYAQNLEFMGSLAGLIDFASQRLSDPTSPREVTRQVIDTLFGDSAQTARDTISVGPDSPVLMGAFEDVQKQLIFASSLPRGQSSDEFLFLKKYF